MTKCPPTTETRTVLRTILSAGVLAVLLLACVGAAAGATWVVDDDGGADFTSIQVAVDAAGAGDTIEVRSGTYYENVDVGKRLTLRGDGADVVTVQAVSSNDHVFDVTADRVNITGFKVTGATGDGKAGIYVGSGIAHSNISNSAASNNYYGIYLDRSSNNILTENTPSKNSMHGIRLAYSSGNVLKNNIVSSDNGCAILLYASVDNRLINNDVSNSFQGIFMYTSSNDNLVSGNTASNNRQGGIYLEGNNNTITGNIASNNDDFGIALESSSNNTLYHNNLDGNTNNNAHDDGTNQWDSSSEGNYYSDYIGIDSDGDGIGDTPYPIPGGSSADRYPLMAPYTPPTTVSINVISPNGSEDWQVGTTQTIQWSYTGNPYGVEIEIFNSSGPVQTFTYVPIGSGGSGSYSWLIPENLASGTDYQVRITIMGSAYTDISGYFTISGGVEAVPSEQWNKTYGGTRGDKSYSVQQTSDGGYILAGETRSGTGWYTDAWLIKTDANGVKQWSKTFGGIETDGSWSVQQTSDGGYILAGFTESYGAGGYDAWLIKTDADGIEQWNKTYGGTRGDFSSSVQQTSDGGYILAGETQSYGAGRHDAWLIKTDADGIEQWNKTFGGINTDRGQSVQQTSDGGYILAGVTGSYGAGNDAWLIKTDVNGVEQWSKTFGRTGYEYSVQQTSDGGYILAGGAWLIKTDVNGVEQWNKKFADTNQDRDYIYSVQQTSDGGYILAGHNWISGADAILIKTDVDGIEQWNKTFGGLNSDSSYSVQQTSDGGYILAGFTESYGAGGQDAWLIKVSSDNPPLPTANIAVTSPNGGEDWQYSTTKPIHWGYTGNPGSDVKIEILKGGIVDQTISPIPIGSGGNGSYDWEIPSTQSPDSDYQVRITSTSNAAYTDISGYFTISAPSNIPPTTNPISVTNTESLTPTIIWTYGDANGDPQMSYEVEVWTGPEGSGLNEWSPDIVSSQFTSVVYAGNSLVCGKTYYVRVRAFDGVNWGGWSETSWIPFENLHSEIMNRLSDKSYYGRTNLMNPDFSTNWAVITMMAVGADDDYYALYDISIESSNLRVASLKTALDFLREGNGENAEKYIQVADEFGTISNDAYQLSTALFIDVMDDGIFVAGQVKYWSRFASDVGLTVLCPPAGQIFDYIYIGVDFTTDQAIYGTDQAWLNLITNAIVEKTFTSANLDALGGQTIEQYTKNTVGRGAWPIVIDSMYTPQGQIEIVKIVQQAFLQQGIDLEQSAAQEFTTNMLNQIKDNSNADSIQIIELNSPGELRVYDSQGEITGVVNGKIIEEIPYSTYDENNERVIISFAKDTYHYEVIGTGVGTYGLDVFSTKDGNVRTFSLTEIPISPGSAHQYAMGVDYSNKDIITASIDSDGDGIFEETINMLLPTASFNYSPENPVIEQNLTFDASLSNGNIVSYKWEFGDGIESYGKIVNHSYSSDGIYIINLTVKDGNNALDIKQKMIIVSANFYNITFLPPSTTMDKFNLKDGSTLPIKFRASNSTTDEFIYDDTVNVTITNSTGHLIAFFTNGTGTDSVRINSTEEQYIVNFHTKNYDLNVGETYTIHVTFGEADALRGYAITHFTLVDRKH